jgi:hypothetical protein
VLSLRELHHVDVWAKTLIGYNPTNTGFQFLQEAYQQGELDGEIPRFKRSQETYPHQSRKVRRQRRGADGSTSCHMAEEELLRGDIDDDVVSEKPKPQNTTHESSEHDENLHTGDLQDESPDTSENEFNLMHATMTGDADGNLTKLHIPLELTDSTLERAVKAAEMIENGGRAYVEEQLCQFFNRMQSRYSERVMTMREEEQGQYDVGSADTSSADRSSNRGSRPALHVPASPPRQRRLI